MKRKSWILVPVAVIGLLFFLIVATWNLEQGKQEEDLRQLEQVLHRTAVACYAVEGVYPPDVDYMRQHYGLMYDEGCYIVHYELFASNLMPEITVMERVP